MRYSVNDLRQKAEKATGADLSPEAICSALSEALTNEDQQFDTATLLLLLVIKGLSDGTSHASRSFSHGLEPAINSIGPLRVSTSTARRKLAEFGKFSRLVVARHHCNPPFSTDAYGLFYKHYTILYGNFAYRVFPDRQPN